MTKETAPPTRRSDSAAGLSPAAELVRRHDRDRFQTALFAPPARREALFALYAFNYEVARVREIVTEPMLGQIRLQWWREAIAAAFAGGAPGEHPVVLALTTAIREFGLSRASLDSLVDSRERDLAPEPPADLAELEGYAEASSAMLVRLALEALGVRTPEARDLAREIGIGYALAGLMRAVPFHAAAGRSYIPKQTAARAGLDRRDVTAWRGTAELRGAVAEISGAAARHLRVAREHRRVLPRPGLPAVLPAVVADRFLARLKRAGYDPFAPELAIPDAAQSWRLAAAMLLNRF
jgi:NADH dehydrogenase [ubiquinone] 1 alpha subcomplex assembly factor 6